MGLLNKKIKKTEISNSANPEHAVIINFNYGIQGLEQLHELEKKLEIVIKQNSVGEYDGHEIAVDYSDGSIYMYGPDAETLFNAIRPTLDNTSFMKGAQAILCFGPPDKNTRQIEITI